MNILGLVPARGGSKGILQKNIVNCAGLPLLAWTANAAENSVITRNILSSDEPKIQKIARDYNLEVPFTRPSNISNDDTPALPVIEHALDFLDKAENYLPDIIVLLQPTSPLRTSKHINESIDLLLNNPEADSVVSVTEVPHQYSPTSVMTIKNGLLHSYQEQDESKNLRQLKPRFWARNGAAIYAFRQKTIKEKKSIYGDVIIPYVMKIEESIDIDSHFDLQICSMMLNNRKNEN